MSRAPELPRLVNFSDSDMSTDSDSDEEGKEISSSNVISSGNSQNPYLVKPYESSTAEHSHEFQQDVGQINELFSKKEVNLKHGNELGSKLGDILDRNKCNERLGLSKYDDAGSSRDKRSNSKGRSRSCGRKSRSRSRSVSRGRSASRGRKSGSRGRRSNSRGRRSTSIGRSGSRDRSKSRNRRSGSRGRRSESRGRRSRSRSRSRSRDRRRRSHSSSRNRHRRSRSRSRGKHRRSRSSSRRRKDRRYSSPRRSRRSSPPRAYRTLDTLEKLGIELKPAAPQEEAQPAIPPYYNRLAVNPSKYAQQMAKRKLLWGSKSSEEGTAKASTWQGATFSQDQDGKMSAKFKRLMGIKEDGTPNVSGNSKGQDLNKRQQELFSSMELQYEAARQATHTQRGVGLGFSSHPHHFQ